MIKNNRGGFHSVSGMSKSASPKAARSCTSTGGALALDGSEEGFALDGSGGGG